MFNLPGDGQINHSRSIDIIV